jgi:hypothetical protein
VLREIELDHGGEFGGSFQFFARRQSFGQIRRPRRIREDLGSCLVRLRRNNFYWRYHLHCFRGRRFRLRPSECKHLLDGAIQSIIADNLFRHIGFLFRQYRSKASGAGVQTQWGLAPVVWLPLPMRRTHASSNLLLAELHSSFALVTKLDLGSFCQLQ